MELITANLIFALVCYGAMMILAFILKGSDMMSYRGLWLCINGGVFTIAALSMSYLVGSIIKSKNAQSAIANTLPLGLSFISGTFIPQELLGSKTLAMASLNPIYWYVKANNVIGSLSKISFDTLGPILTYMLIQLGFAAAVFSIALVVSKQQRIASS